DCACRRRPRGRRRHHRRRRPVQRRLRLGRPLGRAAARAAALGRPLCGSFGPGGHRGRGGRTLEGALGGGREPRADVAGASTLGSDEGGAVKTTTAIAAVALAVLVAACGAAPGANNAAKKKNAQPTATATSKPDISKAGPVTLTVWDQEVRGGQNAEITRLNKEFMAKYPNVTIKRVARAFKDLQSTVKLAVSGPHPPDVVEANQGRPIMGALVTAGILRPLDDYAKVYGWRDRYSPTLLSLNSFSSDGKDFGSGNLYGLSQMGEIVGLFYNKTKVPN